MLRSIGELHCEQVGTTSNEKSSLIHPLQDSCVHDHIAVISCS